MDSELLCLALKEQIKLDCLICHERQVQKRINAAIFISGLFSLGFEVAAQYWSVTELEIVKIALLILLTGMYKIESSLKPAKKKRIAKECSRRLKEEIIDEMQAVIDGLRTIDDYDPFNKLMQLRWERITSEYGDVPSGVQEDFENRCRKGGIPLHNRVDSVARQLQEIKVDHNGTSGPSSHSEKSHCRGTSGPHRYNNNTVVEALQRLDDIIGDKNHT